MIKNLKELRIQKQKTIAAKKLATESQLQLLQQQINPLFLFNALNSLRSLIAIDTERARDMVNNISAFLRESLVSDNKPKKLLSEELKVLDNYLNIQKVRWENALLIRYNVASEVVNYKLPGLMLQPLAENAIKHGMKSGDILTIEVCIKREGKKLLVSIINNGKIADNNYAKNGGNQNIIKRLNLLYGDNASFSLYQKNKKVYSEITIIIKDNEH